MSDIIMYLLQVSAGSVLLYLCFIIFYRNDTFYQRNRILLILSTVLPVIIPLINIITTNSSESGAITRNVIDKVIITGINLTESLSGSVDSLNYTDLFFWLWISVAIALAIKTFMGVVRTFIIIRKGELINNGKMKIVVSDLQHPPFSFYPFAVIPREIYEMENNKEILAHEEVHICQMHTLDLLLSELFVALFWFNPVSWLIKKSIVLNHEYLADNETIHKSAGLKEYQYMLLNIPSQLKGIPIAHNFNSNLKNRIVMINRKPTNGKAALKNLVFLPAVMVLILAFSFRNSSVSAQENQKQTIISDASLKQMFNLIYREISYPDYSKKAGVTGIVYITIRKDNPSYESSFNVKPDKSVMLQEVVIIAFGNKIPYLTTNKDSLKTAQYKLIEECLAISSKVRNMDLIEIKQQKADYTFVFNFQIK